MKIITILGLDSERPFEISEIVKNIIKPTDVVIALTASGSTKFTIDVVKFANNLGALTVGVSNNVESKLENYAQIPIILDTGAEVVAGSTRLKAGTAQKICLNLISTLVMTRLGKVKKGMMNNLIVTNKKLSLRKKKIDLILSKDKGP